VALFIFQSHLADKLGSVFYIGFHGPRGSGKTTAMQATSELCRAPLMTGNVSPAALARAAAGHTLFVDEFDALTGESKEMLDGIFRTGYRKGVAYIRCEGKDNHPVEHDVYGPKAYTLRGEAEDALTSRTYTIRMESARGDPMRYVLLNFRRDLSAMAARVMVHCRRMAKDWDQKRVDAHIADPGFGRRVSAVLETGAFPRDMELATACMLVADIVGVDLRDEIRAAFKAQREYDSDEADILGQDIYQIWNNMGQPPRVATARLLEAVNEVKKFQGGPKLGQKRFRVLMGEIGIRKGIDIRRTGNIGDLLYFDPWVVEILTPSESNSFTKAGLVKKLEDGSFTENSEGIIPSPPKKIPSPTDSFTEQVTEPMTKEEVSVYIYDISVRISTSGDGNTLTNDPLGATPKPSFTVPGLIAACAERRIPEAMVREQVDRWLKTGEVYQPRDGRYSHTGAGK